MKPSPLSVEEERKRFERWYRLNYSSITGDWHPARIAHGYADRDMQIALEAWQGRGNEG